MIRGAGVIKDVKSAAADGVEALGGGEAPPTPALCRFQIVPHKSVTSHVLVFKRIQKKSDVGELFSVRTLE